MTRLVTYSFFLYAQISLGAVISLTTSLQDLEIKNQIPESIDPRIQRNRKTIEENARWYLEPIRGEKFRSWLAGIAEFSSGDKLEEFIIYLEKLNLFFVDQLTLMQQGFNFSMRFPGEPVEKLKLVSMVHKELGTQTEISDLRKHLPLVIDWFWMENILNLSEEQLDFESLDSFEDWLINITTTQISTLYGIVEATDNYDSLRNLVSNTYWNKIYWLNHLFAKNPIVYKQSGQRLVGVSFISEVVKSHESATRRIEKLTPGS